MAKKPGDVVNYMSIDFEEWYHGLTSTSTRYDEWPGYEDRIEVGHRFLLETFEEFDVKATYFTVGKLARDNPNIIRELATAGHEMGLHSDMHNRIDAMTADEFRQNLADNIKAIKDITQQTPKGYRCPFFSMNSSLSWFWEELAAQGVEFDSSLFPIKTPLYGDPSASRVPYVQETKNGDVREFPMPTLRPLDLFDLPFAGGFYFRALPYWMLKALTQWFNAKGKPVIYYFHPWEFDPDQPKPSFRTPRERVSHYWGLAWNRQKMRALCRDFNFAPMGSAPIPEPRKS